MDWVMQVDQRDLGNTSDIRRGCDSWIESLNVRDINAALRESNIRHLLLDWDGCMTRISGEWHGVIAVAALSRSETFTKFASVTLAEAIHAYEGPGHGIDWFALFEKNLIRPKLANFPHAADLIRETMREFRQHLSSVADMFARKEIGAAIDIPVQSGVWNFLARARDEGVALSVVTMTPTVVVRALALRSGLSQLIDNYFGCDLFESFSEGKRDPLLWREAARISGGHIAAAAIVEDSPGSLRGAVQSGAPLIVAMQDEVDELVFLRYPGAKIWSAKTVGDMTSVERFDPWLYY